MATSSPPGQLSPTLQNNPRTALSMAIRTADARASRRPGVLEPCTACPLCGTVLFESEERRYQPFASVVSLIRQHCSPTPFVYQTLLQRHSCTAPPRVAFCIPCINWVRRLRRHALRCTGPGRSLVQNKRRVRLIPIDELITFLIHPGEKGVPDLRSLSRLLQTLLQTSDDAGHHLNQYFHFAPAYTRLLATHGGDLRGETAMSSIVTQWWIANGMPQAFTNKVRARHAALFAHPTRGPTSSVRPSHARPCRTPPRSSDATSTAGAASCRGPGHRSRQSTRFE